VNDDLAITSPSNPRIRDLATLHKRREREARGRFLVEGAREISRGLSAGITFVEIVACPELESAPQESVRLRASAAGVPVTLVSERAFTKVSRRQNPDGLVAVAASFPVSLASLDPRPGLVLIAEATEKPGNLGAMLRTADATGAALIAAGGGVDVFNPNVVRASQGAVFSVPLAVAEAPEAASWIAGIGTVAVATPDADRPYWDFDMTGPTAIVVGSEHAGVSPAWQEIGTPIQIPMAGQADSLNTSVAAAVLLYEAVRQRSHGSRVASRESRRRDT
jgi:TrmH family RNA methyltransferase